MPHKLAEHRYPGTIDEKMQEYCADIRILSLYAFGFRDGSHFFTRLTGADPNNFASIKFTYIRQRPVYIRIYHAFWRWIYRLLHYLLLSSYTRDASAPASTDSFASDMLTLYNNHLLHDPHAVRHEDDARERITIRTLLRAVMHYYTMTYIAS
ncbi:Aminoglycoside phosphotransferase [Tolypocladium capitatum]|uniref:Aminoglycoside phosphotransferase n=1 Tax=Tolypocladium capitatum TaxID=45235 RepID=A0A2K3QID9_9HYPO|nr:Aminoglycoside phosphotransferase [Tolypocladium capitatum]